MISLRAHAAIDVVVGVLMVFCPFVLGFSDIDAARDLFVVAGIVVFLYSLGTRFVAPVRQEGARAGIPIGLHLIIDVCTGVLLMLAPTLFDYRSELTGPALAAHFAFGLALIGLVAMTRVREGATSVTSRPALRKGYDVFPGDDLDRAA